MANSRHVILAADSVLYDALGNAVKTWTPLGRSHSPQYFTESVKDAIGRDTLVKHPIDGGETGSTRIMYDAADRVIRTVSSGPARPYTLSLSGIVRDTATITALARTDSSGYDAEGNLTYKGSVGSPWTSDVNVIENLAYDAAGRLRKRLIGTGPDSMVYDPAGNLVSARHRSGSWVTQSYDALNRITTRVVPEAVYGRQRCNGFPNGSLFTSGSDCRMLFPYHPNSGESLRIPADTARFVYDALTGEMRQANNRYARVRRAYYPGGAIKTDSTWFGGYSSPLTDSIGRGQEYAYDLAGRRTSMIWHWGVNAYAYNDFAALEAITGPHADVYRFVYDMKGQIDSLTLGTGVREKRLYDDDGRMLSRNRVSTYGTLGTLVSNVFSYDRMNRVTSVSEQTRQQPADQTIISYDGLGAVLAKEQGNGIGGGRVEEFRSDAFGNVIRRRTRSTAGLTSDAPFINQYGPMGDLMTSTAQLSNPLAQYDREDQLTQVVVNGGQLERQSQVVRIPNGGDYTLHVAARHYYGGDDRLMAVQRYSYRSVGVGDGTWEEYRYDALGRRVLTRARRDQSFLYNATESGPLCSGTIQCRSFVERVWWDGDQALVEDRTPDGVSDVSNSGVVRNIHGLTLDEPIALIADQTRIINYNWRGQGMSSVTLDGQAGDISLGNTATTIDWPAATQAETYFAPSPDAVPSNNAKRWLGTFVANGQGTTGMLYRRDRYFDPKSGQFTQADPIGIAGGMNVFGFANGDPINYSDPFGLCVDGLSTLACLYAAFEIGSTAYDVYDLGRTAVRWAQGRESGSALAVTAAGAGVGVFGFGGGYGRMARAAMNALDYLSSAAKAADRGGLTKAGRALAKHNAALGNVKGSPADLNRAGQEIVDDVLTNPGSKFSARHHARFGDVIEVRAPDGRGVRYNSMREFMGFLDPNK